MRFDRDSEGGVVSVEPLAAAAGEKILAMGGNAIDAAVSTAFVQGVVNPMMCGLGGTAKVNLYLSRSDEHLYLKGLDGASSLTRPDIFEYTGDTQRAGRWTVKDNANYLGYKASIIPTFVRVTGEVHRLFGSLPWEQVLEPAVELAAQGFEVSDWLASRWDPHGHGALDWPSGMETLTTTEACAKIYLKEGKFYLAGETLVQSDYANTLRRIASEGPSIFYEGEIGKAIAADFANHNGLLSYEDLLRCRVNISRPLEDKFREYTLHGNGSIRLEMYNILEGFDLRKMGHNSPEYLDILARVFQIAYLDRARYIADPRFEDVPDNMIKSKQFAAGRRYLIETGEDIAFSEAGDVPHFGTTALVVMDKEQNTVALTHSNGNSSGVVTPGLGFLFNNHMHNFNPKPGYRNSPAPNKMPESSDGPVIVCKDGNPLLVVGHYSRGGPTAEVQVVMNVIEHGMSIEDAVSVPRIHAEYQRRIILVDPDFPSGLIEDIEALGNQEVLVKPISPAVSAIHCDPKTGKIQRGVDPRGVNGKAVAP